MNENPTHEEKIETLTEYFLELDEGFSEREAGELTIFLKALILHLSRRYNVSVATLLDTLNQTYEEKVVANRDKTDEEMRQLLLDELARQEELAG